MNMSAQLQKKLPALAILCLGALGVFAAAELWSGDFLAASRYGNLLRLHVIANSNSPADQELKLHVRDGLIPLLQELTMEQNSAQEAQAAVEAHQAELAQKAAAIISAQGYTYSVRVELGNFPFPQKQSNGITLPQGTYKALKVTIGQGTGRNWWCILFPPLCYAAPATIAPAAITNQDRPQQGIQWRWRFFNRQSTQASLAK